MFIFCKSDKEFFRDDDRDPLVPAPDNFLRDLVVEGVAEDLIAEVGGDLMDLVNVPFAPIPPPKEEDADVDVVPDTTIEPGLVPGGGGNMIAPTAVLFIPLGGKP